MLTDDDLAVWIAGLDDLFARVAGRFVRVEPRCRARAYVRGLLGEYGRWSGGTVGSGLAAAPGRIAGKVRVLTAPQQGKRLRDGGCWSRR